MSEGLFLIPREFRKSHSIALRILTSKFEHSTTLFKFKLYGMAIPTKPQNFTNEDSNLRVKYLARYIYQRGSLHREPMGPENIDTGVRFPRG